MNYPSINQKEITDSGKCFNCDRDVPSNCYCYGCNSYVCEDCEAGFSIATALGSCKHHPESHLIDYDGEDL